jgi:hypothetical protein
MTGQAVVFVFKEWTTADHESTNASDGTQTIKQEAEWLHKV